MKSGKEIWFFYRKEKKIKISKLDQKKKNNITILICFIE